MTDRRLKVAVLISGTGSNLKALIDAKKAGKLQLDIVRVISNRQDAAGIEHANSADIPVSIVSHKDFEDRKGHDAAMAEIIDRDEAELVILAGFMRILSEEFTRHYANRMINLHPSLLPLHKGLDTYNRALQAGDSETGASIHFVTFGLDSGPVISQVRIPIGQQDDEKSLKMTLGPLEHSLLVATVDLFCKREITCRKASVSFQGKEIERPLLLQDNATFNSY